MKAIVLFCFLILFFSNTLSAQYLPYFDPTAIDEWQATLVRDIQAQILIDDASLGTSNFLGRYNRRAADNQFLPVIGNPLGQHSVNASERQQVRNSSCFDGVLERRLINGITTRCNMDEVQLACQSIRDDSQRLLIDFRNRWENLMAEQGEGAMTLAKRMRSEMKNQLVARGTTNNRCSSAIEDFLNHQDCINTYSDVLEPLRELVQTTCTVAAVENQFQIFKNQMVTPGSGGRPPTGYAVMLYNHSQLYIEARQAEINLAQVLQNVHNFIMHIEGNEPRGLASSVRPQERPATPPPNQQQVLNCETNPNDERCRMF